MLSDYIKRRIWRIYPPLIVATLLSGVIIYLIFIHIYPDIASTSGREYNTRLITAYHDLTASNLLNTLTFTAQDNYFGFNHQFWSLRHELIFYLLFPLYNLCSSRVRLGLIGACLVLAQWLTSDFIFCQLFFLTGTLFHDLFRRGYTLPWVMPKWAYYLCFVGLYVLIYLLSKQHYQYAPSALTIVLAFLAFEFLLTHQLQVPRVLTWLGTVSYSVYLNHMWVLMLCYAILSRLSGRIVFYERWPYYIGAIIAIVCSSGLYYLVEKPVIAYLRRIKVSAVPVEAMRRAA